MKVLITLELDGLPPTANLLYRNFRGRRYKTPQGRKYQEQVAGLLRYRWSGQPPYEFPVELRLIFTTDNRRRWDIDNRVKALQDYLSMARVIKDDRQVEILHVERQYDKKQATYMEVRTVDKTARISE